MIFMERAPLILAPFSLFEREPHAPEFFSMWAPKACERIGRMIDEAASWLPGSAQVDALAFNGSPLL